MKTPVRTAVALAALSLVLASCSQSQEGAAGVAAASASPTVLVLDSSGSMAEPEGDGNRMDAAKKAATGLVDAMPDDAILGLVAYGTSTGGSDAEKPAGCADVKTLQKAVALDRGAAAGAVAGLEPSGFTPIGASLRHAAELLPADGVVAIVLLSDGEDTCAPPPPCEVARELKAQRPGLTISTVGFKTANEELSCIASATGGLYLTADNTDQLVSRLVAAQNAVGNADALTPTGLRGVELGQGADDIRAAHSDFPAVAGGDQVIVAWMDCDWVFDGGVLTEIRPSGQADFRTVDGLAAGADVSKAVELYGEAVEERANPDGTTTSLFTASEEAGTAWKVGHRDTKITTVYLCKCLPKPASGSANSGPEIVGATTIKRFGVLGPDGSLILGSASPASYNYGCKPMDYGPQTEGLFACGKVNTHLSFEFCSKAGATAYCPVLSAAAFVSGPQFESATVEWTGDLYGTSMPGQIPWAIELDDGSTCTFGSEIGVMRDGHWMAYLCGDGIGVWTPTGGAAITESAAGWTVMVGGERGTLRQTTVRTAVFLAGD